MAVGAAAANRNKKSADSDANAQQDYQQGDDVAEIEKLAALRDKGILTEEEFEAKKQQILGI